MIKSFLVKRLSLLLLLVFILGSPEPILSSNTADASLELYGTFHAMGITVTLDDIDDPNSNAVANVEYRTGDEPYRAGFPLSRTSPTRFIGSLFWLEPETSYDVRVTFSDPDGAPLHETTLQATASTRTEISIPSANNTYIVSPTGVGNTCSLSAPCSLLEGIYHAQPGDAVVLQSGVYYAGDISLPRSGEPGAPIVIRGGSGAAAILDGADPAPLTWTSDGNGVYYATTSVQEINLVTANGSRIYPYDDLDSLQELSWGIPGYYTDGDRIYVHLDGDAHPDDASIVISRYRRGFDVTKDHIYFIDLTFRHYGQESEARAIYFNDASDNLVHNSVFAINNGGITIRGASHRNVIQNNEFYDTIYQWPWESVKAAGQLERGGVYFGGPGGGRGNVVRRNSFHDYFDGFDVCPSETEREINPTNETDVYDNLVYNLGDDGLQVDGWCSNVRLWDNTFHDVLNGISFAPSVGGPFYAIRNLIYRFGAGNNEYRGGSFKFNSSSSEQSGLIYLIHNTADAVMPVPYAIQINSGSSNGWDSIYAYNNIWTSVNIALRYEDSGHPVELDYNNLWTEETDRLVRWDEEEYGTLTAFAEVTDQEPNGFNVEPDFISREDGVYYLNPTSALVDAGVIIPGINDNYNGLGPDIGAFESPYPRAVQYYLPIMSAPAP